MTTEEEVSAILRDGGYAPMPAPPFAGLLCKEIGGGYWMGGVFEPIPGDVDSFHTHMKDPPDDPIAAAHRIVAAKRAKMAALGLLDPSAAQALFDAPAEQEESAGDEAHGETGGEGTAGDAGSENVVRGILAAGDDEAAPVGEDDFADGDGSYDTQAEPLDADFTEFGDFPERDPEPRALDADLTPLRGIAWDENTVADELGAEILDEGQAPQDRFYGLDDLDRRRSLRIGDVVRVSRAKQEAIWAASGTTEDAYQDLVSAVMRDTINGVYTGPATQFDQFTALQAWANQAHAVARAERGFVAFLTDATREQVEAFDPEADWP